MSTPSPIGKHVPIHFTATMIHKKKGSLEKRTEAMFCRYPLFLGKPFTAQTHVPKNGRQVQLWVTKNVLPNLNKALRNYRPH